MAHIENWRIGKIFTIVLIIAIVIGTASLLTVLLTPSEIREYRVKLDDRGIYCVIGIVRYGQDFISYQTMDGREAIGIANELNNNLTRENNGARPYFKPTALKGIK